MLICDIAVIVDLLWFIFVACSGSFRLSVDTWDIFLAYIRRRLSSLLRFHVFWEAGCDTVYEEKNRWTEKPFAVIFLFHNKNVAFVLALLFIE